MPGVTHIQISASLQFDDGFAVTLTSPVWQKDIRNGDYFTDEQIANVLSGTGEAMANQLSAETALAIYKKMKLKLEMNNNPNWPFYKKPNPDEPFSPN